MILVQEILDDNKKVIGVIDALGLKYSAKAVILCTGTFLNGEYI
ncbi:FAD-dependent oxidoreductase, partial [Streptobacillus moniliformis]